MDQIGYIISIVVIVPALWALWQLFITTFTGYSLDSRYRCQVKDNRMSQVGWIKKLESITTETIPADFADTAFYDGLTPEQALTQFSDIKSN